MRFQLRVRVVLFCAVLLLALASWWNSKRVDERLTELNHTEKAVLAPKAVTAQRDESSATPTLVLTPQNAKTRSDADAASQSSSLPATIAIGSTMDPEDPLSWPAREATEIRIGSSISPTETHAWNNDQRPASVAIGGNAAPEDSYSDQRRENVGVRRIGSEGLSAEDVLLGNFERENAVIEIGGDASTPDLEQ